MAKITQIATTASTEEVSLQPDRRYREREVKKGEQMQEKTESGSGEAQPVLGLSLQNPLPSPTFVILFNCLKVGQG